MSRLSRTKRFLSLIFLILSLLPVLSYPCTTLFLPQSPDQVVATNMDWLSERGLAFINKRDVQKTSAFVNPPQTALQWTSKYMSLTFSHTGREFPWEGMNEKGVAVNILLLPTTQLPPVSAAPALNSLQFIQYILDTAATTAEAVAETKSVRITGPFGVAEHFFVCDATGDCATIENIAGSLAIHEGPSLNYMALANDTYHNSRVHLATLLSTETSAQVLALPMTDSLTRFAKAALLSSEYLPQANNDVSYAFSALQTLREADTQWQMVFSLANRTLQFKTASSPTIKSIDLNQFDPHCSSGIQIFRLKSQLSGDVTPSFFQYTANINNNLVESNIQTDGMSVKNAVIIENYPGTTECTEENVTLAASPNSSTIGQTVVLTAYVEGTGPSVPTGNITFLLGTIVLGTGVLDSTGTAQLTTAALPAGANSLLASYGGDALNAPIVSPPLSDFVYVSGTQITLASALNPTTTNLPVTFTVTLVGLDGGNPTGTVTFSKNGSPLATVPLTNGQASYTKMFTNAGMSIITASYSGDNTYGPNTSSPLTESVN